MEHRGTELTSNKADEDAPLQFDFELQSAQMPAGQPAAAASTATTQLVRLKAALQLYVTAKFIDRVTFTRLQPKLQELGVSARFVNGAWGILRDALSDAQL